MIKGLLMNTEEINQLWAEVCSRVKSYEGIIGPQVDALFSQLFPQAASDGFMMLTANTEFIKNFIERHYIDYIKRAGSRTRSDRSAGGSSAGRSPRAHTANDSANHRYGSSRSRRRTTSNSPCNSNDAGNRSAARDACSNYNAAQPRPAGSPGARLHCSTGYRNGAASRRCPRCCSRKRTGATSCSDTCCSQPGRSRPAGHLDR